MIFPLMALAAPIAALNAQASFKSPKVITNEEPTTFLASFLNQEPDTVAIKAVTFSLRTPGKDYRKTYSNYSVAINQQIESGKQVEIPLERTFSVPTKHFDVLLDFEVEAPAGTEKFASEPIKTEFKDPATEFISPKFILSVVAVLGFAAAFSFMILAILRPDILEEYVFAESAKPQQAEKRVERTQTPDAPDAWLPEKHKKKKRS